MAPVAITSRESDFIVRSSRLRCGWKNHHRNRDERYCEGRLGKPLICFHLDVACGHLTKLIIRPCDRRCRAHLAIDRQVWMLNRWMAQRIKAGCCGAP